MSFLALFNKQTEYNLRMYDSVFENPKFPAAHFEGSMVRAGNKSTNIFNNGGSEKNLAIDLLFIK